MTVQTLRMHQNFDGKVRKVTHVLFTLKNNFAEGRYISQLVNLRCLTINEFDIVTSACWRGKWRPSFYSCLLGTQVLFFNRMNAFCCFMK